MRSRTVLPGKPQATLQAICTGEWGRRRLIAYVSGGTLVIIEGVSDILQTIYHEGRELKVVTLEEESGKFAVGSGNEVLIYGLMGIEQGILRWVLQSSFKLGPDDGDVQSLSWGRDDEILVGSNSLSLWEICPERVLWRKDLANPIKLAIFSHDATLVASIGASDRLVKVWERLNFGCDDVYFGFSYLPHPRAVTGLHWRRPFHKEETIDCVLYTLCVDSILRIWAQVQNQDQGLLQLWAAIDIGSSIPIPFTESSTEPESLSLSKDVINSSERHVLILDSKVFTGAAESAVRTAGTSQKQVENLTRLTEIASRNPDIVVVFDGKGRMSAFGLDGVGKKTMNEFYIVNEGRTELMIGQKANGGRHLQFLAFSSNKRDSGGLVVLAHFFDGQIYWFDTRLDELLDPAPPQGKPRLALQGIWSGHSSSLKSLIRTANGKAIMSSTDAEEHIVWTKFMARGALYLLKQSELFPPEAVQLAVVMDVGKLVLTMHRRFVILWDTSQRTAVELGRCEYSLEGKVLSLLLLPESNNGLRTLHVVAVTSMMRGIAWEIKAQPEDPHSRDENVLRLQQYSEFDLGETEEHHILLSVDPVGWTATMGGTLDRFSRDVVTSITPSGFLRSWSARVNPETKEIHWLATFSVDTGVELASLLRGSSLGKVAVVGPNRNDLSIWATRCAQLEYQVEFEKHEVIMDLDWACTPDSQSILSVGFRHRVLLLSQMRYDYLQGGPSWAPFREVKIRDYTPHPIGDSIWLDDGALVVGTGNQLYLQTRRIEDGDELTNSLGVFPHRKAATQDIFAIVSYLNGPLPVYHPQFLQQCILAGRPRLVQRILVNLHKELRSYHEEIPLDSFLGIPLEAFYDPDKEEGIIDKRNVNSESYFDNYISEDELSAFGEPLAASLCDLLTKIPIPYLTGSEQMRLAAITECVAQVDKHRRSMDENGARYLLFFKQYILQRDRKLHSTALAGLTWREIVWAFHSVSQEILVDLVSSAHKNRMLWSGARGSGMFMWLRDTESVRKQWEILARNHYTCNDERNPVNCSLHYLALHKKNVLVGLWRIAHGNKEQALTYKFLSNNFNEPRWRTAAKKNAYALLGKQRYEYAAAFFLVGDSLKDCVNICFNQMKDPQLAIAIARVYEGDHGPVLRGLLQGSILPMAIREGNRWMATWAFWMLRRKDLAVRAILSPLHTLLTTTGMASTSHSPGPSCHLYLTSDPALIILYKLVRDKTTQTLRGHDKISPADEFEFVLHTARIYDRMGCDLLALELVKNWEFLEKSLPHDSLGEGFRVKDMTSVRKVDMMDGWKRHRRRSSITISDEAVIMLRHVGGGKHANDRWMPGGQESTPPHVLENSVPSRPSSGGESGDAAAASSMIKEKPFKPPPPTVFQEPDMSWAFDF